jgi:beta-glucosidase
MPVLKFPDGFFWGTADSAHQVEGGQHNDWSEWERLGKINDGTVSGNAVERWSRYEADFDIAKSLHQNAHRFSIEWSRIEPEEGTWDESAIRHYQAVVAALRARGIEPFVTLWHYTNPLWFSAAGGWESAHAPRLFARYAERIVRALPDVKFWMTLNEPNVFAYFSYLIGYWPPEVAQLRRALRVHGNLAKAHRAAYAVIKKADPSMHVGFANSVVDYVPLRHSAWFDRMAAGWCDWFGNRWFVERVRKELDYIGVNHYFREAVRFGSLKKPIISEPSGAPKTDYGWGICPEAMGSALRSMWRYRKPLYITENGLADAKDQWRGQFIKNVLIEVHRAISEGVDVRGYLHWSLLDILEWREGFSKRFGLVAVDFETQKRTVRESAQWFSDVCKNNRLET